MSRSFDKKYEQKKRVEYAVFMLTEIGIYVLAQEHESCIEFYHKGSMVKFLPYTGWHTGKSIKDGRGLNNLLKQLS